MRSLLDKRLVLVTGKGGVGKTTIAAALGLAAAGRGKRVIVCEVADQQRLAAMLGAPGEGGAEQELSPGLFGVTVDPERAKEEWLRYQLKSDTLAGLLGGSRVFQYLTAAAPGLTELVTMGKIWDLAQLERRTEGAVYDLAIVDAPATGHGLAMLRAPSTYAGVARVGPIRRQALIIDEFVRDPAATGVVAAALPEEIPVNETIELEARLGEELGMKLDAIVVNAVYPQRFNAEEARRIEALDGRGSAEARAAARAALSEHRRARAERAQAARLRRAAGAPVMTLPHLFEPAIGPQELERLSRVLERRL
ncbi:MAG TPA: ArsA-related P-loop ATPase [Thermoleophilaceae bacterium]|nr:ArsA-related P-loop ATPase [Thermoleophilaceae bacterium]